MKKRYNTDFSKKSMEERWAKAGSSQNLDAIGRDNHGKEMDYSEEADPIDTTDYTKKVVKAILNQKDEKRRK
jgi:hypothetical protein